MLYRILHSLKKMLSGQRRSLLLSAAAFLFLTSVILSVLYLQQEEEALSSRIAPSVLRFHVLANSDSNEDQALKLEVKQMLIEAISEGMSGEGYEKERAPFTREALTEYVQSNQTALEVKAERYMAARGYDYSAAVRLERCYFPTKVYGDVVFPCGYYDAVRVLLGNGEGKNWWCVLYPPLCFTDSAVAVVPDESKAELQNLLTEDDYSDLMRNRRVVFGEGTASDAPAVHIRFRFLELMQK